MVLYGLLYGAELSNDPPRIRREVEHFAGRLTVLPFDNELAAHTAEMRGDLEKWGRVIEPYDLMIAAHWSSRGLVVVTGNLGEFQSVHGLRCELAVIAALAQNGSFGRLRGMDQGVERGGGTVNSIKRANEPKFALEMGRNSRAKLMFILLKAMNYPN